MGHRTYTVILERGEHSWGAYVPDLPVYVAAGQTREEAEELIREANPNAHRGPPRHRRTGSGAHPFRDKYQSGGIVASRRLHRHAVILITFPLPNKLHAHCSFSATLPSPTGT